MVFPHKSKLYIVMFFVFTLCLKGLYKLYQAGKEDVKNTLKTNRKQGNNLK